MQFNLRGFSQVAEFRVFAFEGVTADRTRVMFTVRADLTLIRRYGIQIQELPLLCKTVLDGCHEGTQNRSFEYAEENMRLYADAAAARAEAAKQHKSQRLAAERAERSPAAADQN